MSVRIGIAVGSDACSAVVVRGGRVRWFGRIQRDVGAAIAPAMRLLLAGMPVKRRSSRRVSVSLGTSRSQIKRILGLPPGMRADVASRLVQQNAASFFLRSGPRIVTTGVERDGDGVAWSGALDGAVVDDVIEAIRDAGLTSPMLMPEVLAVAHALPPGTHRVVDGDVVAEFSTTERRTFSEVRRAHGPKPVPPDEPPAKLRSLGDDARQYVSAFGAAICPGDRALVWRSPRDPKRARFWSRVRLSAAVAAFALSGIAAVVAPGIRASIDATRLLRLAEQHATARNDAARLERELRTVSVALDRMDRFESRRAELSLLLGELARALPDSTALVSLRIDSMEVNLSALTPRAADVVSGLDGMDGVASPRIVGSVMRDAGARSTLERATIRLRRHRS